MLLISISHNRPPARLRHLLATVAALAALVALPSPVLGDERGSSGGSYQATCGHLGVPCMDDGKSSKERREARRACRASRSARSTRKSNRRARHACRSKAGAR